MSQLFNAGVKTVTFDSTTFTMNARKYSDLSYIRVPRVVAKVVKTGEIIFNKVAKFTSTNMCPTTTFDHASTFLLDGSANMDYTTLSPAVTF